MTFYIFRKSAQKIHFTRIEQKMILSIKTQYIPLIIYRSILLKIRNISDKFVDKMLLQVLCSIVFFYIKLSEKFSRAGKVTDENTAHAHFTLGI
jgi:hypothetical protein